MPIPSPLRAAAVATTVATALAVATPALAAVKPRPPAKPKPAAVKLQHFTAKGLVVSATPSTLRVITNQLTVGGTTLAADTVVTVDRPAAKSGTTADIVGYSVTLAGNAAGSGKTLSLTASQESVSPRPAQVFLGTVTAATATSLKLAATGSTGGDDNGDEPAALTVDISGATSTMDGTAGTPGVGQFAVVLGERDRGTVVAATVEGFASPPTMIAGTVTAVSGTTVTIGKAAPAPDGAGNSDGRVAARSLHADSISTRFCVHAGSRTTKAGDSKTNSAGRIAARRIDLHHGGSSGTSRTGVAPTAKSAGRIAAMARIASSPSRTGSSKKSTTSQTGRMAGAQGNPAANGKPAAGPVTLDLAPAGVAVPVVLNGGATVDPGQVSVGEDILVLGTRTDAGFTPTVVFAFNGANHYPARHHGR